jgi:hypothetical protein
MNCELHIVCHTSCYLNEQFRRSAFEPLIPFKQEVDGKSRLLFSLVPSDNSFQNEEEKDKK